MGKFGEIVGKFGEIEGKFGEIEGKFGETLQVNDDHTLIYFQLTMSPKKSIAACKFSYNNYV